MISIPKPVVIVVGADKGGVGKTTLSRSLLDYFAANNAPIRAFDTETPKGVLQRFHPLVSEIVDLTTTPGQMRVFDTLDTGNPGLTLIDARAGLMSQTLATLRDIGFLDAAKSGQITFAVAHILGSSIASLNEIADTAAFMDGAKYYVVKNHINNTTFFDWDEATYNSYFSKIPGAASITIPRLDERANEKIDLESIPFSTFIANRNGKGDVAHYSFVLRGITRHWLSEVWAEFDRAKLTELIGQTQQPTPLPKAF